MEFSVLPGMCWTSTFHPHLCAAAEVSLIKLTFSHDTSPHCTRFSSILKTELRESAVRCCCPGDTSSTTAWYASSTAGDPDTETSKPQQARSSSAELCMSECWRDETWIGFREKQSRESSRGWEGLGVLLHKHWTPEFGSQVKSPSMRLSSVRWLAERWIMISYTCLSHMCLHSSTAAQPTTPIFC